jgi:hypothetical protein
MANNKYTSYEVGEVQASPDSEFAQQVGSLMFHTQNLRIGESYIDFGSEGIPSAGFTYSPMVGDSREYVTFGTLNGILRVMVVFSTTTSHPLVVSRGLLKLFKEGYPSLILKIAATELKLDHYGIEEIPGRSQMTVVINPLAVTSVSFKFDLANSRIGVRHNSSYHVDPVPIS